MRIAIGFLICTTLAGCISRQIFPGPARPIDEIAIIEGSGDEKFVRIAEVTAAGPQEGQDLNGGWHGHPIRLELLPGTYQLFMLCEWKPFLSDVTTYARPMFAVQVQAGMTYKASCKRTSGSDIVRVIFSEGVPTSAKGGKKK